MNNALVRKEGAILYARVSSKKQRDKGTSLDDQIKHQTEYCIRNKWDILGIYKEAYTGKKEKPVLLQAIEEAKSNENVKYFVIFDFDRFGRDGTTEYQKLKEDLFNAGITLKDSKQYIQDTKYLYEYDDIDMSQYAWNRVNPSEVLEVFFSTYAKIEGDKILQRTIPREIRLEKQGYQVRAANYGLANKKIKIDNGEAVIQVPGEKSKYVLDMFKQRAKGVLTDQQIVDILNMEGCTKNKGQEMDVKYMREIIANPIYAGIRQTKWTGNKPIIVPYKPLVSIKLWNQANKGKKIIHKHKDKIVVETTNKRKKTDKKDTEDYIFRGMLYYQGKLMSPYRSSKYSSLIYYREAKGIKPAFNIGQNTLIELLGEEIKKYALPEKIRNDITNSIDDFIGKKDKEVIKNIGLIEKEINKLMKESKEVTKKNIRGKISDILMEEIVSENDEKIERLQVELIENKKRESIRKEKSLELLEVLLNPVKLWDGADIITRGQIAKMIWLELSFDNKKELRIAENQLFKLFKNVNVSLWQAHEDSNPERGIWSPAF